MIRSHHLDTDSAFIGQTCALCKQEFGLDDEIVICPEDGSRHHVHCWEANNNHCTAYGCRGQGRVGVPAAPVEPPVRRRPPPRPRVIDQQPASPPRPRPAAARPVPNSPGSKVRTLPAGSFGCVRGCFVVVLIVAVLVTILACAGAWFLTEQFAPPEGIRSLESALAVLIGPITSPIAQLPLHLTP